MAETPQTWINRIQEKLNARPELSLINAVYKFVISGENAGEFALDLTKTPGVASIGAPPTANCTIIMNEADFDAMMSKAANPMVLFQTQKLKVEGNLPLSLKLMDIIK